MKKGFTLIELLAVIIILAIVALIATPIILDVVEDAKKSAAKSETSMILSGIQSYCASADVKLQLDPDAEVVTCSGTITKADVAKMVNLGNAELTTDVTVNEGGTYTFTVKSNGYSLVVTNSVIPTSYDKAS